jgi:uncharacterized protein YjbJ (UPF0337 family)
MTRITNEVLAQMILDINKNLDEVKGHVKETNGKVADAHLKIAEVKATQLNCPARTNYNMDKESVRKWIQWIPVLLMLLLTIYNFLI